MVEVWRLGDSGGVEVGDKEEADLIRLNKTSVER